MESSHDVRMKSPPRQRDTFTNYSDSEDNDRPQDTHKSKICGGYPTFIAPFLNRNLKKSKKGRRNGSS
jgi:hypothetical protein